MPKPTLLQKGKLIPNDPKQAKKLEDVVPMDHIIAWFKNRLGEKKIGIANRVLVLLSDTGSGKSTALPVYLYNAFHAIRGGNIAISQPRVLTAKSIPLDITRSRDEGVPIYPNMKFGINIGYTTGPSRRRPLYGITYMTIGVLTQQLLVLSDDVFIKKYQFVILDEVHEMNLELALVLMILKSFMIRNESNQNLPFVIIMSATFVPQKFLDYFDISAEHQPNLIKVAGFSYPREVRWLPYVTNNYIQSTIEVIMKIHTEGKKDTSSQADILVFLPSPVEIKQVAKSLDEENRKLAAKGKQIFIVMQIDRQAIAENKSDYLKIYQSADKLKVRIGDQKNPFIVPQRRIILSTSVAETGVTIDTLKYCVDCGYHRSVEYNANHDIRALLNKPASQSRVMQRWGRIGRKFAGYFYPLYPEYIYEMLEKNQFSDIITESISNITMAIILNLVDMNTEIVLENFDLIDTPPTDSLHSSLEKMYVLGFINILESNTMKYSITDIGRFAAQFIFTDPEQIRMLLAAYSWNVNILDMVTIMSYLSNKPSEFKHKQSEQINWVEIYNKGLPSHWVSNNVYKTRLLIADEFIDGLILFNAVLSVIKSVEPSVVIASLTKWCLKTNISYNGIMHMIRTRDDIIEQLLNTGLNIQSKITSLLDVSETEFMNSIVRIKHCIYDGYILNVCKYDDKYGKYVTITGLNIEVPDLFTRDEYKIAEEQKYGLSVDTKPKYIIVDSKELSFNNKSKLYQVKAGRCSVLDGFIDIDLGRFI